MNPQRNVTLAVNPVHKTTSLCDLKKSKKLVVRAESHQTNHSMPRGMLLLKDRGMGVSVAQLSAISQIFSQIFRAALRLMSFWGTSPSPSQPIVVVRCRWEDGWPMHAGEYTCMAQDYRGRLERLLTATTQTFFL